MPSTLQICKCWSRAAVLYKAESLSLANYPVEIVNVFCSNKPSSAKKANGEKVMARYVSCALMVLTCVAMSEAEHTTATLPASKASFTVWQLPNQGPAQMMSYVVRSIGGRLIVIDGGRDSDASYLKDFIRARGSRVEAWFVTHAHDDHVGALTDILRKPDGITIDALYASLPESAWMKEMCDPAEWSGYQALMTTVTQSGHAFISPSLGETLTIDGIAIAVLGLCNPEFRKNPLNNSSMVLRFSDSRKSVLFLGDLGFEGGEKLLSGPMAERLPSMYVQMAHHGQNGVGEAFYQKVAPMYCLWPTPRWLWDNDSGKGKGSGHWRTEEVRQWMERLSIRRHFVMCEGLQTIE